MAVLELGLVLFILIIFLGVKIVYEIGWKPKILEGKLRKQGINVLQHKPPDGNLKQMAIKPESMPSLLNHDISSAVFPLFRQLATTYNKKPVVIWYAMIPNLIIMDPKLIREMLARKFEFQKPTYGPIMKLFLKGLANINGDKWAMHRKIITPAFHIQKLKGMLPSFMASCEEMVEKWKKLIGSADCYEMDVLVEFQDLAGDIISRAAFGSNLEEGKLICSLQRKQGRFFFRSFFDFNSAFKSFLPSKLIKNMKQINDEIRKILEGIIKNREKATLSGNAEQNDLLNLLLKSNLDEIKINKNIGMSREDVTEECKLFYFAGHETVASLLTWTVITLSMHQDWQEKARNEVLQLLGKNKPTFDDLNRLRIVNMILLEVLRLYPPTYFIVRSIQAETKLGEYNLPAGTILTAPLHVINRDPEIWGEDALEFNPERFSDGISKASKDQSGALFSFGWGPRACIGQNFAMLEAKSALVLVLQHFTFHLSTTYKHSFDHFFTLQPQIGAQIMLQKYTL